VVGEQVGADAGQALQLDGRAVGPDELVDDGEPGGVAEGGMPSRAQGQRIQACDTKGSTVAESRYVESSAAGPNTELLSTGHLSIIVDHR
jgi:hypothetical protein